MSCVNEKCVDPCPGFCGYKAICSVIRHRPTCNCPEGYVGDSYSYCRIEPKLDHFDVCNPSPCGRFSKCADVNGAALCSCVEDFVGSPPNCRPECETNSDCLTSQYCSNYKCKDLCVNICGQNAVCEARFHKASCNCLQDYVGDPYTYCSKKQPLVSYVEPCENIHCGVNANCISDRNRATCRCQENYVGDPYVRCSPECILNSDCPYNEACIQSKCRNPCDNQCGFNAECYVRDHIPRCMCISHHEGNPYVSCTRIRPSKMNMIYSLFFIYSFFDIFMIYMLNTFCTRWLQ